jgi:hypothetical protein
MKPSLDALANGKVQAGSVAAEITKHWCYRTRLRG